MESTFILFRENGYDGQEPVLAIPGKSCEEAIQKLGARWERWETSEVLLQDGKSEGMPDEVLIVPKAILEKYGIDCRTDLSTGIGYSVFSLEEIPTLE